MITKKDIKNLQSIVNRKAYTVGHTNNDKTRAEFDEAIENLIVAEKEFNQQNEGVIQMKIIEQGDILLYIGNEGEQVGVVKDVGLDGLVRVASGHFSTTVHPDSFIEVFAGTERSKRTAKYLNR